jgi:hypothetical protein
MILSHRHIYYNNLTIYKNNNKKKLIFKEIQNIKDTKYFEIKKCIVCENKNFEIINEIDRYGFYYPTGICKNCGMIQQTKYYNQIFLKNL